MRTTSSIDAFSRIGKEIAAASGIPIADVNVNSINGNIIEGLNRRARHRVLLENTDDNNLAKVSITVAKDSYKAPGSFAKLEELIRLRLKEEFPDVQLVGVRSSAKCGNAKCEWGEDHKKCPEDCSEHLDSKSCPGSPVCGGNGACTPTGTCICHKGFEVNEITGCSACPIGMEPKETSTANGTVVTCVMRNAQVDRIAKFYKTSANVASWAYCCKQHDYRSVPECPGVPGKITSKKDACALGYDEALCEYSNLVMKGDESVASTCNACIGSGTCEEKLQSGPCVEGSACRPSRVEEIAYRIAGEKAPGNDNKDDKTAVVVVGVLVALSAVVAAAFFIVYKKRRQGVARSLNTADGDWSRVFEKKGRPTNGFRSRQVMVRSHIRI